MHRTPTMCRMDCVSPNGKPYGERFEQRTITKKDRHTPGNSVGKYKNFFRFKKVRKIYEKIPKMGSHKHAGMLVNLNDVPFRKKSISGVLRGGGASRDRLNEHQRP
jgi:hypothetical protein